MKKNPSAHGIFLLVLSLVTFSWVLFHTREIFVNLPGILKFAFSDFSDVLIAGGYLVMLLFHVVALIFILRQARFSKPLGGQWVLMLGLGILSLFAIAMEKVMYDEIAHEITAEYPLPTEVPLLVGGLAVNGLFCIVMIVTACRDQLSIAKPANVPISHDERVFTLAQVMGVVSGSMGLVLTLFVILRQTPPGRFWIYLPFFGLFLIPYTLVVLYWLVIKRRARLANWFDEKQVRDVLKGSLTALILSVPGLFLLALARWPLSFYWFPYYLFLILLLLSASTLFYFKRR